MDSVFLKILCDVKCIVYIDNNIELVCRPNELTSISLSKGAYWIKCVCDANHKFQYEETITINQSFLLNVSFKDIIKSKPELLNDDDIVFSEKDHTYVNVITGNALFSSTYDYGEKFKFGLASVENNGKRGCVDKTGKEVIPCAYNSLIPYTESLIWVRDGVFWGLINTDGKIIISHEFDDFLLVKNGLVALRKNSFWGLYDHRGIQRVECQYSGICDYSDEFVALRDRGGSWSLYNEHGTPITVGRYNEIGNFYNGLACVKRCDFEERQDGYGYINKQGVEKIGCIYDDAKDFSNGVAIVRQGKFKGIINTIGQYITECIYDDVYNFKDGVACVMKDGKYGCIRISGEEIVPCICDDIIYEFCEGLACVKIDGKYGCINVQGEEVLPCVYEESFYFHDGLACVKRDNKYGCINIQGEDLIPYIYDYHFDFEDGLASVTKHGLYGLIDMTGKEVISCQYQERLHFHHGLALTQKNDMYGCIDLHGKEIIPFLYKSIRQLNKDTFIVERDNSFGLLSSSGTEIVPCQYERMWAGSDCNMICISHNGRYGVMSSQGQIIIPCKYDNEDLLARLERNSEEFIRVKQNGFYGLINKSGKIIVPCRYRNIEYFTESLSKIWNESRWMLINNSTLEIVSDQYHFISALYEGLAVVGPSDSNRDGGYINSKGDFLFSCELGYKYVNGIAYAGDKFIDKQGRTVKSMDINVFTLNYTEELLYYRSDDGLCRFINQAGEDITFYGYNEYCDGVLVISRNNIFEKTSCLYELYHYYDISDYFKETELKYISYDTEKMNIIIPKEKK